MKSLRVSLAALTGALVLLGGNVTLVKADLAPEVWTRSVVSAGDTARLQRVLTKAERGESITVGVIGGSITQGAKATTREKNYGSVMATWWRQTFPKAKIQLVNAGIGATGSNYGALRAGRDLLSKHPDFVIVEFAVNDGNTQASAESCEGLIRQILNQPNQPAVVMLFMMNQSGNNAQEWLSKVGAHYHLPMISYRDALWPEMQAKHLKWEDVEADQVHPNDIGHSYAAGFVTHYVDQVRVAGAKETPVAALPKPLFSDRFEHVALLEAEALKPVTNQGWAYDAATKSWKSNTPGSVVEFEINGTTLLFMDYHLRGPMGRAKVQADNLAPVTREAWFDQTWGGYRQTTELGRDLPPGKHKVRVELLPEKHAESTGNEFRILGLGAAGVTP